MASKDVQGNTMASQAAFERQLVRIGEQLFRMENAVNMRWNAGCELRSIVLRVPKMAGGDWLAIVKADVNGSASVAFVSSDQFADCVRKVVASLESDTLKWKDDEYAG